MLSKALAIIFVLALIAFGYVGWVLMRKNRQVAITPDQLTYPCLRIIDESAWERIDRLQDLHEMSSNLLMSREDPLLVVDSEFRVFEMSRLSLKGSALGLMITGPRTVQVEFELVARQDMTIADAKALVRDVLTERRAAPGEQTELESKATTLDRFLELIAIPGPELDAKGTSNEKGP